MDRHLILGVPHIDQQHADLFRLFEKLNSTASTEDSIDDTLSKLTMALYSHFRDEEALLKGLIMPANESEAHLNAHADIVEGLTQIHLDAMRGRYTPVGEIVSRIASYVLQHIVDFDLPMKAYIRQTQQRAI